MHAAENSIHIDIDLFRLPDATRLRVGDICISVTPTGKVMCENIVPRHRHVARNASITRVCRRLTR